MQGYLKLSTAVNITILMVDSTDHVTGKTGLAAGLTIYATKAAGTPATITPTVTELDATNVKGVYKLALTSSHTDTLGELQLHITATGADPADYKWQVSTYLPGEAATLQADQAVNTTKFGGTTVTGRDIGASVLLSTGTGTGQLDFTSGIVKSNLSQILGTALTETAGQIAAAFKQFFDVASPTGTMKAITNVVTATNLTNAPTAGDFTAAMKTSLNAATPAVTVSDKTGFSLSSAGVQAIWDALTSALTTVGSVGKLLVDNINAAISSRLATSGYTAPDNSSITAIKAKTDNLTFTTANKVDATIQAAGDLAQAAADKVWSTATRILTAGTNIALAKGTGVTGFNDLSAAQVNAEVVDALTVDTLADSVATDGSLPTLAQAILMIERFLMEKSVSGTTVTVKKEDGTTSSMTFTLNDATAPTSITRSG